MDRHAPSISSDIPERLITPSQAAKLLGVHISTVRRWITQGKLPAYRVGGRGIRIRSSDVEELITPLYRIIETGERMGEREPAAIRHLTGTEQERGLRALAEMRRLRAELTAARGKPADESWKLLDESRNERTRDLMDPLKQ
jgi:excisionase family DNA binding protein